MPCRKARLVSYQHFLHFSKPISSDRATELSSKIPAQQPREHMEKRGLTSSWEEHSCWALKGLLRFNSREIFMEKRCWAVHVFQAGDGFNLPLAKAVIICCWFLLKAAIRGSPTPSGVTALQLSQNKTPPKLTQTTRNPAFFFPLEKRKPFL